MANLHLPVDGSSVITRSIRPTRVAVLIQTMQHCEECIQACSLIWGGKYLLAVPYEPTVGLTDAWKRVLMAYDPDSVTSPCALDPGTTHFLAELCGQGAPTTEQPHEAPSRPEGLPFDWPSIHSLVGALLGQRVEHDHAPYVAIAPDVPEAHPLRLFIMARYGHLNETLEHTISLQQGWDRTFSVSHLIPITRPPIADDFVPFMQRSERAHQSFMRHKRSLPTEIFGQQEGCPLLDYTLTGLTMDAPAVPGIPRLGGDDQTVLPALLVVSDEPNIEDFCWYWNLRAQRQRDTQAVWLPLQVIEDQSAEVAALFPADQPVLLMSTTVDPERLHTLARMLGPQFSNEHHDLDRFYVSQLLLGIKDRVEVVFERGQTRIPVPTADEIRYAEYPRHFFVDIDIAEIQLPRLNVRQWGQQPSMPLFYRVSRTGLSFQRYSNEVRFNPYLHVLLPTPWQMLETFAELAGYAVQVSDKGAIGEQFLHLVGGMQRCWIFSGHTIHTLFNQLSDLNQSKEFRGRLKRDIGPMLRELGSEGALNSVVDHIVRHLAQDRHDRVHQTVGTMKKTLQFKRPKLITTLIEWLLHRRLLFRGDEVKCPICKTKQWLSIDSMQTQIQCRGCQQLVDLPLRVATTDWNYQMNALAARAYSAGVIPHLLTLNYYLTTAPMRTWFHSSIGGVFPGIQLKAHPDRNVPYQDMEIDVAWIEDGALSIGECKTNGYEFTPKDVEAYATMARVLRCHRVVFATTDVAANIPVEVRHQAEQSPIPIEFLTQQDLFNRYRDDERAVRGIAEVPPSTPEAFEEQVSRFFDRRANPRP